jgi:magnesium-transporting ATPase (P-type)
MALGDQENDIAMIEYAGMGVAMENAIPVPQCWLGFVKAALMRIRSIRKRRM